MFKEWTRADKQSLYSHHNWNKMELKWFSRQVFKGKTNTDCKGKSDILIFCASGRETIRYAEKFP